MGKESKQKTINYELRGFTPGNCKRYDGSKIDGKMGGTMFILTTVIYLTTIDGDKAQLAIFLNNLSSFQNRIYQFTMTKLKFDLLRGKNLDKYEKLLR